MNRVLPEIQPCSASHGDSPVVVEAKRAISTTPETYSGVAVEAMEKIDNPRSSRDPSRIPDSTPIRSEAGTMTIITQSINIPVAPRRSAMICETGCLNTVEKPQSPCNTPQRRGAAAGSCPRPMQRPVVTPSSVRVQPGITPSHSP